jgi:hypothetical protein
MTTKTEAPPWGAQQSPGPEPTRKGRRTALAVGTALVLTLAGGGIVYATSGTGAAEQTSQGAAPFADGQAGGPAGGPFGTNTHGEFQQGEVTEISSSSVSVQSDDGYTKTYTIPSDVVSDVQAGDTVTVVSGDGTTATSITEAGAAPTG